MISTFHPLDVRVALVHAEEIGREQGRLVAAVPARTSRMALFSSAASFGSSSTRSRCSMCVDARPDGLELLAGHGDHVLVRAGSRTRAARSRAPPRRLPAPASPATSGLQLGELVRQLDVGRLRRALVELGLDQSRSARPGEPAFFRNDAHDRSQSASIFPRDMTPTAPPASNQASSRSRCRSRPRRPRARP